MQSVSLDAVAVCRMEDGLRTHLRQKGSFFLCCWDSDQACCDQSGWCLELWKSQRNTKISVISSV